MPITLEVSPELETRQREKATDRDVAAVRQLLMDAVEPTVTALLRKTTTEVSDGEFEEVIEHLNKGLLKPDALISKIMHGSDIQEAFELIRKEKEKYLKVMLDFSVAR